MIDDPKHDEGGPEPAIEVPSHTASPHPDEQALGGDELTSGQFNQAGPPASGEETEGADAAAGTGAKAPTGSRERETTRTEEEIREAEEMTNDSALPGLVSEDIGGAGAALNSML